MRRKLVIEMETVASPDNIIQDILEVLMNYADCNEEFSLRQEILPEKSLGQIRHQNSKFLSKGRVISQQEKGRMEAIHKKGVM